MVKAVWGLVMVMVLALMVALAVPAQAQTPTPCPSPCTLVEGATYALEAEHTGADTTGYNIYIDNVKFGNTLSMNALAAGVVKVTGLVAVRGTHTIQLSAVGPGGESAKSAAVNIVVGPGAPVPPKNLKILIITVTVADNGTLQFQFSGQ